MHIRVIVTIAILGISPRLAFSQEPATDITTIEQETVTHQTEEPKEEPTISSTETVTTEESTAALPEASTELTTTETPLESSVIIESMPEPIKEEPIVIPEEPEKKEKPVGIDTVSLENPQGNWLFKRIWWERAEERYEKIRLLVDAVWESRTIFFVKRNELDRNVLDPFYLNVGIGQGELQTILSE